jgi:hypothetical protein
VTEEQLTEGELTDRVWAIVAAAAENRPDDMEELLVTLPWPDAMTVVFCVAQLAVAMLSQGADPYDTEARARVADQLRALIVERMAGRDGA